MMLRLIPLIMAALLMAAHFLREKSLGLMLVSILIPLLLLTGRRWSLILVQASTYAAAVVWLNTAIHIVRERMIMARPYGVAVVILGSVTVFTLMAGLLLNTRVVKDEYPS